MASSQPCMADLPLRAPGGVCSSVYTGAVARGALLGPARRQRAVRRLSPYQDREDRVDRGARVPDAISEVHL